MTFPVTIDLPRTKETLMRPGMRASVVIVTRRIKQAIVVPADCVFQRDGGSICYVERGGRYRAERVKRGASNGDYTAILAGLKDGDRVALNDLGTSQAKARPKEPKR
jgi:multidrug efflux pump subunit AcrA (membrane-fusion protein)